MGFWECFNLDYRARNGKSRTLSNVVRELLFSPGYRAVAYYRLAIWLINVTFPRYLCNISGRLLLARLSRVPGVEIRSIHPVGAGLLIYHPHDIVIGKGAVIGENVTIYNGVTIGARSIENTDGVQIEEKYPEIGDRVILFTGAKIIGPVVLGNDVVVGANSVVTRSFPDGSIVAGVPAKIVGQAKPVD